MAELSSSATVSSSFDNSLGDSFSSELAENNENEVDAASEGITNHDIFAEVATTSRHIAVANPTVAVINGENVSKTDFQSAGHPVTVPKLLDPQPVDGIRPAGKGTPGIHCEQRVDCDSCLRLASCLWNSSKKKCRAVTEVGLMSRRAQWKYISTCDPSATPTQQHTDRRDRSHVQQAHHLRPRRKAAAAPVSLMEVSSEQVEKKHPVMQMEVFMDEEPSLAVEAAVGAEDINTVVPVKGALSFDADQVRSLLATDAAHMHTMAQAHAVVSGVAHMKKIKQMQTKIAAKTDDFHRTTSGAPNGTQPQAGVDVWEVATERNAETSPLGFPIGVVDANSQLVIEKYAFVNRKTEGVKVKALYGYGYVAGTVGTYGGWAGANSCGWFALQLKSPEFTSILPLKGSLVKSTINHPHKCPDSALLKGANVLQQDSFLLPSPGAFSKFAAAIVVNTCSTYLNYDPLLGAVSSPSAAVEAGTFSGAGSFGTVPVVAGVTPTNKVANFGVRYVTKDGKYALINFPLLAPTRGEGNRFYFVATTCIKFDQAAVKALKATLKA